MKTQADSRQHTMGESVPLPGLSGQFVTTTGGSHLSPGHESRWIHQHLPSLSLDTEQFGAGIAATLVLNKAPSPSVGASS
jgi:hypothetical protein